MTSDEIFENVLSHFTVKQKKNNSAQCLCPSHPDKQASLSISKGNKGIVIRCHAGCDCKDIVQSVGLQMKDLFYDYEPKQRVSKQQYWNNKKCQARYDYYNIESGEHTHIKYRMPNKQFPQGYEKNGEWHNSTKDIDTSLSVFCSGSVRGLKDRADQGGLLLYCEGEKDCLTVSKFGYLSFTCGSAREWNNKRKVFDVLKNAKIICFGDNEELGTTEIYKLSNFINGIGGNAVAIIPPDVPEHGDISDYMQNHTKEDLDNLIEQALEKMTVADESPVANTSIYDKLITLDAVNKFETNDKGFGRLYAEVYKDKHRYNPSRKDFMMYDGKRWIDDIEGMGARSDAKYLSDILVKYAVDCGSGNGAENHYLQNVIRLASIRQRENMVRDAKDIYYFTNESLDQNDYLLNVQNGTLDLSEDTPRFMPHSPDMLLSKICNAEYNPNATCEEWNRFLMEVMQNDTEKIKYLQKICGLSLTGCTQEETCFILYGSTTRNGKSTFCETIIHLLGDYALTMKPETLAVKPNSDSRTASGDVARLAGCRFCNASEPPKKMLFDTALLKSLLGRDSITARHLHQREFSFIPKFKLVVNTNYLPSINDDTVFSSGRINVISFDRHFSESEQDKTLKSRLQRKEELSGILNWCIDGLKLYRQEGLNPPQAVIRATEQYRSDSDKIGSFVSECLTWTGRNSKAKNVYEAYSKWCVDNGYGCENKGNFFSELKSKGMFAVSGTIDGKTFRNIVKGYTIEAEFTDIPKSEQMLFK